MRSDAALSDLEALDEHAAVARGVWNRDWKRSRQRTVSRLQRVRWDDPENAASAHRKARGTFWGAVMAGRILHNREQTLKHSALGTLAIYEGVLHVPAMDAILSRHGRLWEADPDGLSLVGADLWPAHLQWGADRLIETARHLRAGRTLAAAINVRNQIERWTLNAADSHGVVPTQEEKREDFITRVWQTAQRDLDLDVGQAWAQLSEIIHGRGDRAVVSWSLASRNVTSKSADAPADVVALHDWIAAVAVATFSQVRACAFTLCKQAGEDDLARRMLSRFQVTEISDPPDARQLHLDPVDPFLAFSDWAQLARISATAYRTEMEAAGQRSSVDGLQAAGSRAIRERRARTIERFGTAWEEERVMLGKDFDPPNLIARLFRYQAIADGAEVVAHWPGDSEAIALRLAAEALRAASYMWLEDSNLALFAMRTVLEQTCVARTWRTKPSKAARMVATGGKAVAPSRWIGACGLNRAQVVGRALGEFSHIDFNSRWVASRKLLEDIQDSGTVYKAHTARGNVLETVAYLLAHEVVERLEPVDEAMAEGFRREVTLADAQDHADAIETFLNRAHSLANFDFGEPDVASPPTGT